MTRNDHPHPVELHYQGEREPHSGTEPRRSFRRDLLMSFSLPLRGDSLIRFLFYLLAHLPLPVALMWTRLYPAGWIHQQIKGWLAAWGFSSGLVWLIAMYDVSVVADTARGDDELPQLFDPDNFGADGIGALFGSVVAAGFPLGLWLIIYFACGIPNPAMLWTMGTIMACLGIAIWPLSVLAAALHEKSGFFLRYDQHLMAMVYGWRRYLPVLCSLVPSFAGYALVVWLILFKRQSLFDLNLTQFLLDSALWAGGMCVLAYSSAVAMRNVGLFYRHGRQYLCWQAE
jgi:hypothetical protein